MKHFRVLLPFLILALIFCGCGNQVREPYDYTFNGQTITVYPETGTIVDGLDVYSYTVEESGGGRDYVITYPNGARYNWHEGKNGGLGGWSEGYDSALYLSGDILVNALEKNVPREKTGSPILGIPLMALGGWNILSPETVFFFRKGWMFKDAEPSDDYLVMTRIGGVITAIAGLVLCFI